MRHPAGRPVRHPDGRPLRVAMVSEHASPLAVLDGLGGHDAGGQNVHVAALAGALADRGHRVEVYTRRDRADLPGTVALRPGVDVVHVPAGPATAVPKDELPAFMPWFGAWLAARWRSQAPDVVHAHFWMSGAAALHARAAVPGPLPVVQTFHALGTVKRRHQGTADTSPAERTGVEARLAREADAVVATCGDEVSELAALGADPRTVDVVPCGVDLARFTPRGAVAGPPRGAAHRLLCLGRLVERKGVDTVVAALAGVPGAELVVAGGPPAAVVAAGPEADPDCRRLLAAARAHGVADRVRLLGQVGRDVAPALLRSADVLVSVPWYEPFGIVPVEAMACGVPVVASAVGGMLETVVDGVTGLHVPPADPAALAAAVRGLLADPAARAAMGRRGARRAARTYGWDRIAAATEAVYARLVDGRADGGAGTRTEALTRTDPLTRTPTTTGARAAG